MLSDSISNICILKSLEHQESDRFLFFWERVKSLIFLYLISLYQGEEKLKDMITQYPHVNRKSPYLDEDLYIEWMTAVIKGRFTKRGEHGHPYNTFLWGETHKAIVSCDRECAVETYMWLQNMLEENPPGSGRERQYIKKQLHFLEKQYKFLREYCRFEDKWKLKK